MTQTPSKKSQMLKDTAVYASANYVAQGLGVINSIALRSFMGPAMMGVWSILQVVLGYCGYASFGTTKAMARDYPYLRGKGQHDKAEKLKDMTLTFSLLMSIIPAVIILIYVGMKWHALAFPFRIGLLFIAGFLFIQRFYDLIITLLRSDKRFDVLSQLIMINAAGGLGITFLFVYKWNLYGLLVGTALVTLTCFFYVQKAHPYHFRRHWDTHELLRELKLGIPLLVIAFLSQFLKSLDKLIIAKQLGFNDVGLYSVAMMVQNYVMSLPMQFSHVSYSTLQHEYGRIGSAKAVESYLLKPVFIFAILIPFVSGIAIFLFPPVIHLFLPKFIAGIPAMKVYIAGTYFLILVQFSSSFLVTLDKYFINVPILLLAIGVNFILNSHFIQQGHGLEGVALGTVISFIIYGALTFVAALASYEQPKKVLTQLIKLQGILIFFFGLIYALDRLVNPQNIYMGSILRLTIFTASSLPLFLILEKKMNFIKIIQEIRTKKKSLPPKSSLDQEDASDVI